MPDIVKTPTHPADAPIAPGDIERVRPRGSNQSGLRQFNDRVVLQALRVHGSLPKAELARVTGLTAQTIGQITARLDADGLLRRESPVRGRVGQPSVPLGLAPDGAFAVGIHIGRRTADWLLVDFTGQVRERISLDYDFPDIAVLRPAIRRHLHRLLRDLGRQRERVVGVGVAVPFQLGGWHRMLGLSEASSRLWNEIDLAAEVERTTDLPVSVAKDSSAACVAELLQGRGRELRSFLYLFMDTFVGGALVLDSHLYPGAQGNAGAVASLPLCTALGPSMPPQLVGQASLWSLEERLREHGLDWMAAYDGRALQAPWLAHSRAWLDHASRALAQCIVSGTAFLDLDAVVLDGSIAPALLEALCERTREALEAYDWEGLNRIRLEPGNMGSDARALGGALLPLHATFAPDPGSFLKR